MHRQVTLALDLPYIPGHTHHNAGTNLRLGCELKQPVCRRAAAGGAEHPERVQGCGAAVLRGGRAVPPQQRCGLPSPAARSSGRHSGPAGVPVPPGKSNMSTRPKGYELYTTQTHTVP